MAAITVAAALAAGWLLLGPSSLADETASRGDAPTRDVADPDSLAAAGDARPIVASLPGSYVAPNALERSTTPPTELGDGALDMRGPMRSGIVLDQADRPVVGAAVHTAYTLPGVAGDDVLVEELAWVREISELNDEPVAITDEDGRFEVNAAMTGTWLFVDADGFDPARTEELRPGTQTVTMRLQPAATILVSVLDDATGEPVPGISLRGFRQYATEQPPDFWRTMPPGHELCVRPAPESAARPAGAAGPAPVPRTFVIQRAGRLSTQVRIDAPGCASQILRVPGLLPGEERALEVRLQPECVQTGQLRSCEGDPIAGAEVSVQGEGSAPSTRISYRCITDSAGNFIVRQLAPGTWRFSAAADGWIDSRPLAAVVASDHANPPLLLALQQGGAIAGSVLDQDGEALPDVTVVLQREADAASDSVPERLTRTNVNGYFAFDGLAAGRYTVQSSPGGSRSVELADGASERVVLAPRPVTQVRGRVIGAGAAGFRVLVEKHSLDGAVRERRVSYGETRCAEDGSWTLFVEAGTYRVMAIGAGFGLSQGREFTVEWGEERVLALEFPAQRLEGQVLGAGDRPLRGASVRVGVWRSQVFLSTKTADDGRFVFVVPQGTYAVTACCTGYATANIQDLEVGADAAPLQTLRLTPSPTVRGTVWTANGETAIDGTIVRLIRDRDRSWRESRLKDGHYLFAEAFLDTTPGSYRVRVYRPEWISWRNPDEAPVCETVLTLAPTGERVVDFTLPP
jgi:hypothetical protein